MIKMKNLKNYLALFGVIFITACGLWTDFTTFFNLYYNTKQLYQEAQVEIESITEDPFTLDEPEAVGNLNTILTNLQEKASKILQHESESSYFIDALFMSGYAFYYSGNYIKANRKFQELASMNNEDYNLQSRLWMAKCDLQMRNFEAGIDLLNNVRDSAIVNENEDILEETYRVLIAYHIDRQEMEEAIEEGYNFIEVSDNDELKAKVAYQIGLINLELNNEEEAAAAFESVLDFSPTFETEFYSIFELAKLKKELGQVEESREMLDDLYNEGKYSDYWGDVYYQIGLIEYENENYEKAFDIFQDVNELYSGSLGSTQSNLMLGEIMRNVYADYDSAKTYYDRVKSNNSNPKIKELADVYSQSITSYLKFKSDIESTERQIVYLEEPEEFLRDSVAYQRYVATIKEDQENEQPNNTPNPNLQDTTTVSDTTNISDTTQTSSQDSLFANVNLDFDFDDDYVVKEKPIYPKVGIDSLENKIANTYFDLGNLFFTDLNRLDSAYYYYDKLLDRYPNTKKKPRVLVALGSYWESYDNEEKSDSLYQIVYDDYKTHPIANEAAQRLGKPPLITEEDPAKDVYLEAETEIEDSNYVEAVSKLKVIKKDYPESVYVPKSLYTIGWLYENKINLPDSAVNYYTTLIDVYQNSEFASAVRNKVRAYESEMKRLEQESQADSLSNTTEPVDSLSISDQPTGIDSVSATEPVDTTTIDNQ